MKRTKACALILLVALVGGCSGSAEARRDKYIARGKAFLQKHDYARALLEFQNAAQVKPGSAEVHYQLGLAYLESGNYIEAVSYFKKATELDPQHAGAQLRLTELMATSHRVEVLEDASNRVRSVLSASPDNPDALRDLAAVEMRLGKPDEALGHLQQALAKFPAHLGAAVAMAQLDLIAKDYQGAEGVLQKLVDNAPQAVEPRIGLGRLYVFMRKLPEAETQFRQALALDPKRPTTLYDLGSLLAYLGRKDEAGKLLEQLASSTEKSYHSFYARYLFDIGKRDEAISRLEKMIKEDPLDRESRSLLVIAYLALNRSQDAQNVLTRVLKKNPKDVDALEQRSQLRLVAGDLENSKADLDAVLRFHADSPTAHYLLGRYYLAKNARMLQQKELRETLRLDPKLLSARLELSRSLRGSHGDKAALELMDQTPGEQKQIPALIAERNWILMDLVDDAALRKGIDEGLKFSKTPELLLQDGMLKLRGKDFKAAQASLEEALRLNPGDERIVETLAGSYVIQKQIARSVQVVREYASSQPKSVQAQYFLGTWLLRTGDRKGARSAFELARSIDTKFSAADLSLVRLDLFEGKAGPARERLKSIVVTDPQNVPALLLLAALEFQAGNVPAAVDHARKAVETEPGNATAMNDLAYMLADGANQLDEALKYAQKAYESQPDLAVVSDTIGWVYYKKGLYDPAVRYLEGAVSKSDSTVCRFHLAMAYHKAGKFKIARETYRRALAADATLPEAKAAKDLIEPATASSAKPR